MGAETTIWVEVEATVRWWRESYGVTADDAMANVHLEPNERATGDVSYTPPGDDDEA